MKKVINKILYNFGYVEYDPFEKLLHEVVKESIRRAGKLINLNEMGLRIRIQAIEDDFFKANQ